MKEGGGGDYLKHMPIPSAAAVSRVCPGLAQLGTVCTVWSYNGVIQGEIIWQLSDIIKVWPYLDLHFINQVNFFVCIFSQKQPIFLVEALAIFLAH